MPLHCFRQRLHTRSEAIMGFITPDLPDVDPDTWPTLPAASRLQVVTRHWVEHGFGTPSAIYLLYVLKMAAYVAGAAAVISLTPGLGGLGHIGGVVDAADRVPEVRHLHLAVRGAGPGLWIRSAHRRDSGRRSAGSCIGCGPRRFVFPRGPTRFRSPAAIPAPSSTSACTPSCWAPASGRCCRPATADRSPGPAMSV